MARVRVSTVIDAPPAAVWSAIEDVGSHVVWMEDAVAIHFTTRSRHGVGTAFDCETKVGPFRLTDRMVITEWKPRKVMGVRHVGVVTGTGRFTLRRRRGRRTRFTWDERLVVPWWMGGPVGGPVVALVLGWVWRRNLRNLRVLVEGR